MIHIDQLKVTYGQQVALNIQEPIDILPGQKIGIIGSNGAGKSTLIKALLDLIPYQGQIRCTLKPSQMAVHLQFNEYVETMSCRHIMETILQTTLKDNADLRELVAYFEMEDQLNKKYKHLSGGQKQRFTLIMVLFHKAPVTFFDEMTSGLDFETRQKLMTKIQDWYQDSSATFCLVSHYYEELEQLVDIILLLDHGQVVAYGDKQALFQKYCGRRVVLIDRTPNNEQVVQSHPQIVSASHQIAMPVNSIQEESELIQSLILAGIDYQCTSHDIELMTLNAKAAYKQRKEVPYAS
ncbi:ATP-binding cassette domain-containing protein [Vaginisenegalia massiliensis]|uniref:ATP-binding cassette domain-containing protein n=1 Tax=Vaginisenegalia massiliensis TaxID=2058294 RepID=UPI000F526A5A|nr:ABC transporter ATP-binding protein [Vaginisenegalia massiliensis]